MTPSSSRVPVVISSPLEPEHVERIRQVDPRVAVRYAPELLAVPQYDGDHGGKLPTLSSADRRRWAEMTADAVISFDFDRRDPANMPRNYPALRWVQGTSAGLGAFFERYPLDLTKVQVTTAAGIHSQPLAEFALAGVLYFAKRFDDLARWQRAHQWDRYSGALLSGSEAVIVGFGHIGRRVAATFAAQGIRVSAAVRTVPNDRPADVEEMFSYRELTDRIDRYQYVVLCCPLTKETHHLLDAAGIARLRTDAVLINIARGDVVNQRALIEALHSSRLRGAVLDVFSTEPPADDSPLWDLENVIMSPHSASTVSNENGLLTDLFCDNLRRWLDGQPLRNLYDPARGY